MVLKIKTIIILFLKGVAIGASLTIPGVSGGSMAIVLNVYTSLLKAVANFFNNKLKNFVFLFIFSMGGLMGMLLFLKPLQYLLNNYYTITLFFFIGAVLGSVPVLLKKAKIKLNIKSFLYLILGAALVIIFNMFPKINFNSGFLGVIIAGLVGSVALILPGISFSYCMLILGVYKNLLNAVQTHNFAVLLPFLISLLIGIFLFTKTLNYMFEKFENQSFLVICGFCLGSVALIIPNNILITDILFSVITFLAGFTFLFYISAAK